MVDILALALSHGLLALAAWRLILREDLDRDPPRDEDDTSKFPLPPASARTRKPRMTWPTRRGDA